MPRSDQSSRVYRQSRARSPDAARGGLAAPGARIKNAGERTSRIVARMSFQHIAFRFVQPRDHDQFVTDFHSQQRLGKSGFDLEPRVGRAFRSLPRRVFPALHRRANETNRFQCVRALLIQRYSSFLRRNCSLTFHRRILRLTRAAKFRRKPIQILFVRLGHDRLHLLEMFAGIEPLTPAQPRFVFPFFCQRDEELKVMRGIRMTDD
jgi:hypothetical protein